MEPLSFIAKIIGVTGRVGAAIAMAALALYLGRRAGIEFFLKLDPLIYQTVVVAGIVGACSFMAETIRNLWLLGSNLFKAWLPLYLEHLTAKRTALQNMKALTPDYADALRFLKAKNSQRFLGPTHNTLLHNMERAFLLRNDDPNFSAYSLSTYYIVPDHVWAVINDHLKDLKVPTHPPWLRGL